MDLIERLVKPFNPRKVPSELAVVALLFRGRIRRNMWCLTAVQREACARQRQTANRPAWPRATAAERGRVG
jgi:hypothetical protein